MANMVRWGIIIFTGAMVLTQLGIAKEIVVAAFSIIFGGIVLAMAIAVGLGGRTIAKEALERRLRREKAGDEFTHI
jgi:serine acetyltransferase